MYALHVISLDFTGPRKFYRGIKENYVITWYYIPALWFSYKDPVNPWNICIVELTPWVKFSEFFNPYFILIFLPFQIGTGMQCPPRQFSSFVQSEPWMHVLSLLSFCPLPIWLIFWNRGVDQLSSGSCLAVALLVLQYLRNSYTDLTLWIMFYRKCKPSPSWNYLSIHSNHGV